MIQYIPFIALAVVSSWNASVAGTKTSFFDFVMKSIDGVDVPLSNYRGKVVLVVNVASECGYTPQYRGLQRLFEKYRDQGLVILGFPANNFGAQEPGTNEEIKAFCEKSYGVTFDMFEKISVKGDGQHALYQFLTSKETNPAFGGDIKWNFEKFLIDRAGAIVGHYRSKVEPMSEGLTADIEKALEE